jgi:hypothetical protein
VLGADFDPPTHARSNRRVMLSGFWPDESCGFVDSASRGRKQRADLGGAILADKRTSTRDKMPRVWLTPAAERAGINDTLPPNVTRNSQGHHSARVGLNRQSQTIMFYTAGLGPR